LGAGLARGDGYTNPYARLDNLIRERDGLEPREVPATAFYPPGYPAFVGSIVWVVLHSPIADDDAVLAVGFVQALVGALTVFFVFLLARRVFDARVALLAAALVACWPNLIATTATLQLETVFVALALAVAVACVPLVTADPPSTGRLVLVGALTGMVALVRPTVGLLLVAALATRVLARRPWRETLVVTAVLAGTVALVVLPWTVRNAVRMDAVVPLSTGIGPALCQSRNADATGRLDIEILEAHCAGAHSDNAAEQEVADNTASTRRAVRWVASHPVDEVRMWWWRAKYAYEHDSDGFSLIESDVAPSTYDRITRTADALSFVVLALGLAGIVLAFLARRRAAAFVALSTLLFAAVPIMLFGDPRYKVPATPLFAILAAFTTLRALDAWRGRTHSRAATTTDQASSATVAASSST
jgi:4-amino-4-deoxy-L-arabinose transferase-like glycosyltransferase